MSLFATEFHRASRDSLLYIHKDLFIIAIVGGAWTVVVGFPTVRSEEKRIYIRFQRH